MQASPRVDVDEAPYAPGTDLLYVTELEDAHDLKLRLWILLNVRKISSVFSSFSDLPNASSVGSLNHATLPICVRRSVVCISNTSTLREFPCVSLCVCLHACTQQFTDHQLRLTCLFRRRLDPTAFGLFCVAKHVQRACLILTQSTRVFQS